MLSSDGIEQLHPMILTDFFQCKNKRKTNVMHIVDKKAIKNNASKAPFLGAEADVCGIRIVHVQRLQLFENGGRICIRLLAMLASALMWIDVFETCALSPSFGGVEKVLKKHGYIHLYSM